jgi:hypothetical protein
VVGQASDGFAVRGHIQLKKLQVFGFRREARGISEVRKEMNMRVDNGRHAGSLRVPAGLIAPAPDAAPKAKSEHQAVFRVVRRQRERDQAWLLERLAPV